MKKPFGRVGETIFTDPRQILTQLGDLSVEGASHRSAMEGQPGQTVVAHRVTAEQQTGDLVPLEGEDILAHTTLQYL